MTTAIIAILVGAALYFVKRWGDASAENVQLRAQIASLKRRLASRS